MKNSQTNKKYLYTKQQTLTSITDTPHGLAATSRLSYHSTSSRPESMLSSTVKRVNQLTPKPKISIKEQKAIYSQTRQKEEEKIHYRRMLPKLGVENQKKGSSISYNSIKPIVGFQKYMNLCGIQRGASSHGCSCFPCKWKKLWTKNYCPKNEKLYNDLLQNEPDIKNTQQIRKDIYRTYPECPTFNRNEQFIIKLKEILTVYSIYDPQVGYAQGMNMVAAVLLYHIKDTEKTFWAFVDLMDDQELRMIYFGEFQTLKAHCARLKEIMRGKIQDLSIHMEELGVIPDVFLYGWFLSLMSNCIPLEYMHLVVEQFRDKGWKFIYKLIITYLVFIKQKLLFSEDSSEFLMNIANDSCKEIGVHWEQMIKNCHKIQF